MPMRQTVVRESIGSVNTTALARPIHVARIRTHAEVMGTTFIGTAGMLFYAFVKKRLTLAELEDAVEALSQTIWLAPAVVADVLKKAREADR